MHERWAGAKGRSAGRRPAAACRAKARRTREKGRAQCPSMQTPSKVEFFTQRLPEPQSLSNEQALPLVPLGSGGASSGSAWPWGRSPSRQVPAVELDAFRHELPALQSESVLHASARLGDSTRSATNSRQCMEHPSQPDGEIFAIRKTIGGGTIRRCEAYARGRERCDLRPSRSAGRYPWFPWGTSWAE